MAKRLYLSHRDRKIAGVCGGLAEYFDIDPTIVRLLWLFAACHLGAGVLAYLIAGILNYIGLKKYANVKLDMGGTFIKPLISGAVMGVITVLVFKGAYSVIESNSISCLLSILVAVIAYFVLIFITKTVSKEEAYMLPKGNMIIRVACRLHLIK